MVSWRRCNSCGNLTGDNETHCPFCHQPFYDVINAQTSVALNVAPSVPTPPQQPQDNTQETNAKKAKAVDGFVIENGVLTYYCGFFVNVVIPETVVEIASDAFDDFRPYLNSVTFPKNLKKIGNGAFKDCVNLYNVEFNDQLESIGEDAFSGCKYLFNVKLPESILSIEKNAFQSCTSLREIKIPNGITEISPNTFTGCSALSTVIFSDKLVTIWGGAFRDCCSLKNISFPETLEALGLRAFANCISIESIVLPASFRKSMGEVFKGCTALKKVTYNYAGRARNIVSHMYENCTSLEEIDMKDELEGILEGAFKNCTSLSGITLSPNFKRFEKEAFRGCTRLEKFDIPNSAQIEIIPSSAFADCNSLTSISIPKSIKTIDENAFGGCGKLREIIIPSDSQIESIKTGGFGKCSSLTSISIPRSVKTIEKYAFRGCEKLEKVIIPSDSQLETIDEYAFEKCISLKEIVLPENLLNIKAYAFKDCHNLNELKIPFKTVFDFKGFVNTPNLKLQIPKEVDNLSRMACEAYQKNIQLKNTAEEFYRANSSNFFNEYVVPELNAYTSREAANARIVNSLLLPETLEQCKQTDSVTLIFIRTFNMNDETIYDFIPYKEFSENCIGFGPNGTYKSKSKYQNISTDVNNDYSLVQALFSSSGIQDVKVDIIQAPVVDYASKFILSLKVAPTGATQNFVRVQFPFHNS